MSALKGCRVLDLGIITAGAATSALLADLGAEVIKIESPTYRDPFRLWTDGDPSELEGGLPPFFCATNRNKLGMSIDLKNPKGREIMLQLVACSDVVVENFRRGVLARLGLDFESLCEVNPNIILASVSSQGEAGPDADHVSYGSTLEAVSGLAWMTGYENSHPVISGRDVNYPDQVAAIFSASMIVNAVKSVRNGGPGVFLDISQRELTSFLIGEMFASEPAPGSTDRHGNSDEDYFVQACFQARDLHWLAVSVDDTNRSAVRVLLDNEITDPNAMSAGLSVWVSKRDVDDAEHALRSIGVAAARVRAGDAVRDLEGNGWTSALVPGRDDLHVKGFPVQLADSSLAIKHGAPAIGADTHHILKTLIGYSDAEIQAFAAAGIVELQES